MRKICFIIYATFICSQTLLAQKLPKDTVFCIIDTTQNYVTLIENYSCNDELGKHWQLEIKGTYYNHIESESDFACIVFNNSSRGHSWLKKPYTISIKEKDIFSKQVVVNEKWLHEQKQLHKLQLRVGSGPDFRCNFIVFAEDLKNCPENIVKAHRVKVGYFEFQD